MSDAIHIERGAEPWKPTEATEVVEVLHQFSIPLVGVVRQEGVLFLYWCVTGHAGPENAWAYARVHEGDVGTLRAAQGSEAFADALRSVVDDRVCSFAIASDDKGIIESVGLHPPASFDTAHARGMQEMGEKFQEVMAAYNELQEQFPLLRKAVNFSLVPSRA
jgi:hypothetical protein